MSVSDKVYLKTNRNTKLDPYWEGPFEILELGKDKNSAKLDYYGEKVWISCRRLKLKEERQDVGKEISRKNLLFILNNFSNPRDEKNDRESGDDGTTRVVPEGKKEPNI